MKQKEQYQALLSLRTEINQRLQNLDFQRVKELIRYLAGEERYQKIKDKDNQLTMLDTFCKIWIMEKQELSFLAAEDSIFWDVDSLDRLEKKYWLMEYAALRVENDLPEEYCEEIIEELIEWKISGLALGKVVNSETRNRESNMLRLAEIYVRKRREDMAISLLQYGSRQYPENQDMLLKQAEIWLSGNQLEQAYACLKQIKTPDEAITELIKELELAR